MRRNQRTIKSPFEVTGLGLHTGAEAKVRVAPGDADSGVVFVRSDLPDAPIIPAAYKYIADNPRRTTLKNEEAEVHTVEHLCAALMGLGIDNLKVEVSAPEMPGLDGSALPWAEQLQKAGIVEQRSQRKLLEIREPVAVNLGDSFITAVPNEHEGLALSYTLDFPGTAVGSQFLALDVTPENFREKIAPARTFCLASEIDELKQRGLGRGATRENTIVIGAAADGAPPPRFHDEHVRHKVLDLLGDLFLLGADLQGRVVATKSGHAANRKLVGRLIETLEIDELNGSIQPSTGMDIKEILGLLPHRYPFLLIDRVIELEGYRRAVGIKNVTINEPFFQGHWPSQPIMPGVLILEAMAQLAGLLLLRRLENTGKLAVLWSIDEVKLRRAVVPGDQLRIEIEATKVRSKMGQGHAIAKVGNHKVAEALLTFTLVDAT
jgi:UDP-3-O-[3-hydroxymyristoyl] N-acetylglucosamine deacetylase/3-hydroxyacyl-[acyl-carrier-protein] dehydratase